MNANELAELIEHLENAKYIGASKAATMLRQQQAEIEALKKEAALQRLSDFTQEADNEPVAIRYDFDGYGYQYMDSGSGSDWQTRVEGEFLYTHPASLVDWSYQQGYQVGKETHPAKTLTDEEITEVIKKIASNNEYVYSLYEDFEGIEFSRVGIFEFSRAILRKAQEK